MDPPSDKLWSFQDLRNASNMWNMKGDKALLDILQNIHNVNIIFYSIRFFKLIIKFITFFLTLYCLILECPFKSNKYYRKTQYSIFGYF